LAEQLIAHLGYVGIALILVLGGLGLPIPEEAPIILAAVLSRSGQMFWPLALATCLAGVLLGDFVVYFLGYFYGEKVLSLRLTRRLMTRAREAQIKGYFHRHGFKILVLGRFAVGFRTAAYLTAGILKLPPLKLFLTDLLAASLSTFLMFGLGYVFAQQIQSGIREVQQWFAMALAAGVVLLLLYRFYRGRQRAGLPVGPPVLYEEEPPLTSDGLKSLHEASRVSAEARLDRKSAPGTAAEPRTASPSSPPPPPEAARAADRSSQPATPSPRAVSVEVPHPPQTPVSVEPR
jgi:membrane protein DedA with SNARE-associated domain